MNGPTTRGIGHVVDGVLSVLLGIILIPWWIVRIVGLTLLGRASIKRTRLPEGGVQYAWTVDK